MSKIRIISIHAPQWGATGNADMASHHITYFNPRTPVGCDRLGYGGVDRGAYFNPRTPVGCDHLSADYYPIYEISIHAPQWGATRLGYGGVG